MAAATSSAMAATRRPYIAQLRYKRAITRARSRKVDAADASAAAGEPVRAVVAGDEDEQPHA